MKLIKYLFIVIATTSVLSACIDIDETITLNEDNSGSYSVSLDMGKLFELKGANKSGNTSKAPEKRDTTIYLKDLMQEDKVLTAEEKELFKDAIIKVNVDEAKADMKMVMSCPFKSIDNLGTIKKNLFAVVEKLKALDKLENKGTNEAGDDFSEQLPTTALSPGSDKHQEFTAVAGLIENKVTSLDDYKNALANDSAMMMMQQITAMMGDMNFKTTIITPKEIKNFNGNGAKISDNKKTVSFITSFTEMMESPDKMSYKVEF